MGNCQVAVGLDSGAIVAGIASNGWKRDHAFGPRMLRRIGRSMRSQGFDVERAMADSGLLTWLMATSV